MPVRGDTQINSFVKGLVTEASPLSFPPNTALDIINFKLQKDGTNFRRLGLDFEDDFLLTATGYSTDVLATARKAFYHWPLPNGNPLVDIGVVQIGAKFWFLNLYAENPSNSILNGGLPVTSTVDPSSRFSFAVINNYLLVVSNNLPAPFLVSYDEPSDTITFESSPLLVRDLWGVDDSLRVDEHPSTLSPEHYYNLLNQGWSNSIVSTCTPAGISAINCTQIILGVYPSNSDVWTIGRIGDLTSADVQKYDPVIASRNLFNAGQVPQGHYILELKDRGADRFDQTGLTLPLDREIGTVSCVAAYAGRAFYSGITSQVEDGDARSPILSGAVLFSQTFEQKLQLVKCYQEADPTSPDISDIVDTDGGIIFIPECSVINHLRTVKESLFVFAINGIWEIRGDEGGFRATSFQVNKVSNIGVYSPDSIVEINGQILFWGINGIYAIARNQFGIFETTSLTQPTIQKMYNSIPDFARSQAKGFYDLNNNTVRWLFYSDEAKVAGQPIDVTPPAVVAPTVAFGSVNTSISTQVGETRCVRISDTQYAIIYYQQLAPNHLKGIVCTIDPTTFQVTVGSEITINAADSRSTFDAVLVDTNKIMVVYGVNPPGNTFGRILTVSGSSFTVGASNTLLATTATSKMLANMSTNSVIFSYDSGAVARCAMLTRSGDTITMSATTDISTLTSAGDLQRIDNTRALFVGDGGSGREAAVLTAGATVTVGTPLNIQSWSVDSLASIKLGITVNGVLAHLSARAGTAALAGTHINISGSVITRDVASDYISNNTTVFSSSHIWNIALGNNKVVTVAGNNDSGTRYPYLEALNITSNSNSVRIARTQLASLMTDFIHVTKLTEEILVWSACNGISQGPLITQAIRIT